MESKKVPDVMWFEFLFDKTGTLLTTHLSSPNAGINSRVFSIFRRWFRAPLAPKGGVYLFEISLTPPSYTWKLVATCTYSFYCFILAPSAEQLITQFLEKSGYVAPWVCKCINNKPFIVTCIWE
jgi:hypothetical protein